MRWLPFPILAVPRDGASRCPIFFCSASWRFCRERRAGEFNWSSQHLEEVGMAGRRRSDRALRSKLRSPGRPPVAQQAHRRRFWVLIAAGQSSEDAAIGAGVSAPVGARWFRKAGGMPPSTLAPSSKPLSARYLSFAEREELAIQHARRAGVRQIPSAALPRAAHAEP